MENALITIFIPTYRRPFLLKKAIESVLNQSFKDLIVFVCDNASNDETFEVIDKLMKKDSRIHYFCHSTNIGMLGNYEFGISKMKTKFFSILSDDDILMTNFCELALEEFSKSPDIAFFAGSSLMLMKDKGVFRAPLEKWPREGLFHPPEGFLELIGKYPVPTTVMYRTEATANIKIDFQNNVAWDCDFLLQLAGQFPIAISKKPCGYYVYHPKSFSGVLTFAASLSSIERIISRLHEFPWLDHKTKISATSLLRKDYFVTAHIHLQVYFFTLKRFERAGFLCLKLLTKGFVNKTVFTYLTLSSICFFIPFVHRCILYLQKIRASRKPKEFDHDDVMNKKFAEHNNINLKHLETKSKNTAPRKCY